MAGNAMRQPGPQVVGSHQAGKCQQKTPARAALRVPVVQRRGFRKLHIDEAVWQYRMGRQLIRIISPTGRRWLTDESQVTGMSWEDLERGYWKKWFHGVKPSDVKAWIVANCLKDGEEVLS